MAANQDPDAADERFEDDAPESRLGARRDEDEFRRNQRDNPADDYDDYVGDPRQLAISKVQTPALLMIIGGISMMSLAIGIIVVGIVMSRIAPNKLGEKYFDFAFNSSISIPFGALLTYGSFRMKRLRSYSWARISAILAISSIAYLSILGLVIMPVGIWAFVVLLDPEVQREFHRVRRGVTDGDE